MNKRTGSWLAACAALLWLSACGSAPATRFHTLLPAEPAPPTAAAAAGVSWELLPIVLPAQVNRPQMVLRLADDTLAVLEHDRWIGPLDEELRTAIGERLAARLGPPSAGSPDAAHWRIRIEVLRFDSAAGREARLVADWTLRGNAATLACRSAVEEAAGASPAALVQAHQRAAVRLADAIATALHGMSSGSGNGCPPAGGVASPPRG